MTIQSFSLSGAGAPAAHKPVRISASAINGMDVPALGGAGAADDDSLGDNSDWSEEWDEDGELQRRPLRAGKAGAGAAAS
jgi:hypothetical protein